MHLIVDAFRDRQSGAARLGAESLSFSQNFSRQTTAPARRRAACPATLPADFHLAQSRHAKLEFRFTHNRVSGAQRSVIVFAIASFAPRAAASLQSSAADESSVSVCAGAECIRGIRLPQFMARGKAAAASLRMYRRPRPSELHHRRATPSVCAVFIETESRKRRPSSGENFPCRRREKERA